ncbi:hypothetical protein BTN50_1225 [Candidatus Enterovibrio altilux]|uniref:Uncharacterized protein n=1 Tax=Candidatus Enterovibrio altilux TaxID=1927128 RepID=A0A291B9P9_9GAMM|nr:hypothetical protein BTN50_1225 [Candidatus Enterovibrio luxaltus]
MKSVSGDNVFNAWESLTRKTATATKISPKLQHFFEKSRHSANIHNISSVSSGHRKQL